MRNNSNFRRVSDYRICRLTDLRTISGCAIHSVDISNYLNEQGIADFIFSFGKYPYIIEPKRYIQIDKNKAKLIKEMQNYHEKEHFDLVHSHLMNLDKDIYHFIKNILHIPIVISLHFIVNPDLSEYFTEILDDIDFFIAISANVKKSAMRIGIPNNKIKIISTGVDLKIFNPLKYDVIECKKKFGFNNKSIITYIGAIEKEKGIKILIQAVSKIIPDFDCVLNLCGNGTFENQAKYICKKLQMTNNTMFWNLPRETIPDLLAASDIIVAPSLLPEGLGKIALEAMAMEKPIVASRNPGYEELIKNGWNGILVEPNNIGDLSNALKILLEDKNKREIISKRARLDIANSKHGFDHVGKDILKLYLKILHRRVKII